MPVRLKRRGHFCFSLSLDACPPQEEERAMLALNPESVILNLVQNLFGAGLFHEVRV